MNTLNLERGILKKNKVEILERRVSICRIKPQLKDSISVQIKQKTECQFEDSFAKVVHSDCKEDQK